MNEEKIDNFVDLLFNFDMQELESEMKILENYKKLKQENQQLKEKIEKIIEYIKGLDDDTDDTICYDISRDIKEAIVTFLKGEDK